MIPPRRWGQAAILLAVIALVMGSVLAFNQAFPSAVPVSVPSYHNSTVYHNTTIYRNSTVYQNTTNNITTPTWQNTTTYVNNSYYDNTTKTEYANTTTYVNTTLIQRIPVVNVSGIEIGFENASFGTNYSVPIYGNYSLPIGTVTWIQFNVTITAKLPTFNVSVNAPWVLLLATDWKTPKVVNETVLLGVPYFPGTYWINIKVSG